MIKRITRTDRVKKAPAEWAKQYPKSFRGQYKVKFAEISEKLSALTWPFYREDVDSIIGNKGWTQLCCSECGADCESLVQIGEEPDYEAKWVQLCNDCLTKAMAA